MIDDIQRHTDKLKRQHTGTLKLKAEGLLGRMCPTGQQQSPVKTQKGKQVIRTRKKMKQRNMFGTSIQLQQSCQNPDVKLKNIMNFIHENSQSFSQLHFP